MRGQPRELVDGVGRRVFGERGFHEPLRHEVGIAPVRRGRVGVILDRQAEVSLFRIAGPLEHVLARSHQLDDRQRQVGKMIGIRRLAREQELVERFRVGRRRQAAAYVAMTSYAAPRAG